MKEETRKIAGTVIITIFLGAIGSGVWQYVLDPMFSSSKNIILDIATLGVTSFKDNLYQEVAKGYHESASYAVYFKIVTIIAIALLLTGLTIKWKTREAYKKTNDLLEELDKITNNEEDKKDEINHQELRQKIEDLQNKNLKKITRSSQILFGFMILLIVAEFITVNREKYINSAITNYKQISRIITPYITEKEIKEYESKFSQIQNDKDYKQIIEDMQIIVKKHDLITPEFIIW